MSLSQFSFVPSFEPWNLGSLVDCSTTYSTAAPGLEQKTFLFHFPWFYVWLQFFSSIFPLVITQLKLCSNIFCNISFAKSSCAEFFTYFAKYLYVENLTKDSGIWLYPRGTVVEMRLFKLEIDNSNPTNGKKAYITLEYQLFFNSSFVKSSCAEFFTYFAKYLYLQNLT